MFAATSKWRSGVYHVREYRHQVHDALLNKWFGRWRNEQLVSNEHYDTPRKRAMCLRKLNRSGIRVVKVKVTPIGG